MTTYLNKFWVKLIFLTSFHSFENVFFNPIPWAPSLLMMAHNHNQTTLLI